MCLRVVKVVRLSWKPKNQKLQNGFFDTHGMDLKGVTKNAAIIMNFLSHVEMDLVGEEMTLRVQSGLNRNAN